MKKSKKVLLWSIIPILGVSGGVTGAIAGVTSQNSTATNNSVVALNSTSSLAKSKTTNDVANELKIVDQTYDVLVTSYDDLGDDLFVEVNNNKEQILTYNWLVNKGSSWEVYTSITSNKNKNYINVNIPDNIFSMETWTFKCIVTNTTTKESITSENIKFTITSWEGSNISIINHPIQNQNVSGGQQITLTTIAEGIELFEDKEIGYRWFEYDSENNRFSLIEGANESTYTFTAPFTSENITKKFVCKMYLKHEVGKYITESNQAIVTINKSDTTQDPTESLVVSSSVKSNQASVRANFYPNNRVNEPWYKVNVQETKSGENIAYQWYYVGKNGEEHLIENAYTNELTPNKNLFEAAYKDNSNHKVGIVCKIYKNGQLDTIVDQKANSRFYMGVVVNNRIVRVQK